MRVVVTGATGNLGTSVVERLLADPAVGEVVGIARRPPPRGFQPGVRWVAADVAHDDLEPLLDGADAVIHLAWLIQPTHDVRTTWRANVVGTRRVLDAVGRTGLGTLCVASSVGAYAPGPSDRSPVDEGWPTDGVPESDYSWQKATVERALDAFEASDAVCRVVRIRPALVFKRASARHVRHLFLGRYAPRRLLSPALLERAAVRSPIAFQVVHADDVADAMVRAIDPTTGARGAFNVAAPGIIGADAGTTVRRAVTGAGRAAVGAAWHLRILPIDGGWLSLAEGVPIMSTDRARHELDWAPRHDAHAVLRELLDGLRDDASLPTPALERHWRSP